MCEACVSFKNFILLSQCLISSAKFERAAVLPSMHELQQRRSRYGPARQRRKLRRAAEREAIKSSAVLVNTSEVEVTDDKFEEVTEEAAINEVVTMGTVEVLKSQHKIQDSGDEKVAGEAKDNSEKVLDMADDFKASDKQSIETFHNIIDEFCPDHIYEKPFKPGENATENEPIKQMQKKNEVKPEPTLTKADIQKFMNQFKLSSQK